MLALRHGTALRTATQDALSGVLAPPPATRRAA